MNSFFNFLINSFIYPVQQTLWWCFLINQNLYSFIPSNVPPILSNLSNAEADDPSNADVNNLSNADVDNM